jgi:propanol-preferring alcohol dehydrogenase
MDVLIKVRACGVCGTDLKIAAGKIRGTSVPLIPGHEIAGEIAYLGDRVRGLRKGDPVAVHFYVTCGQCRFCLSCQEPLCENLIGQIGFHLNGGLAEFVGVPAVNVLPLNSVAFSEGAILADAVATPYQALVRHAKLDQDELLVVFGAGGLGLHAVQIGKVLGASVITIDTSEGHLSAARAMGADVTLMVSDNISGVVKGQSHGRGADVVIDLVGQPETLEKGLEVLGPGGRLLVVGYDVTSTFSVPSIQMVTRGLKILGCRASTRADLADVIEWVETNKVKPIVDEILPLEEVNSAYEKIRQGKVMGRIVIIP